MGKSYYPEKRGAVEVLSGVSLSAQKGDSIALLGPSGCGKTTLLHLLAGFIEPDCGEIMINGERIIEPSSLTGVVFQSPVLFEWLNVHDNIGFGLKHSGVAKRERDVRIREYADLVGLGDFLLSYPKELSGGMRQRVALARVLILKPQVLLLDEPFGALDALTRQTMQRLLCSIRREIPVTTVFITHDVEEALILGKRVVVLSKRPAAIVGEVTAPFEPGEGLEIIDSHVFADVKGQVRKLLDVR